MIVHLERQMYPVVLEVMLFSLVYESLNVLALGLSNMFRTLVDLNIRVLSWLMIAFWG